MNRLQNLPIGKSSFQKIRENNDLYVDKTRHIFELVDRGEYYFLSRPRRFGKSLTVSTLKCLFEGKKELFQGLWIAEKTDWEWKEHPVVVLDFNEISHDTPENLETSLNEYLLRRARMAGVEFQSSLPKDRFADLVVSLHQKTGARVAVLIDEYDKPLIDHIGKGPAEMDVAAANRDILKHFFGTLKGAGVADALRFVFVTGVSKFSRVSIFSDLNNLSDLTMNRRRADMLGYTQEELERDFAPHLEALADQRGESREVLLKRMRTQYNGYRFSKRDVRVYNPYSVLRTLEEMEFANFWFETGTPTFLVNLLKETGFPLPQIEKLELDEGVFSTYDLDHLKPEALLFQTGYITIAGVQDDLYVFRYPNREVRLSFTKHLLFDLVPAHGHEQSRFRKLQAHLAAEDLDAFVETMRAIFAGIPYTLETRRDEAYFHTVFYLAVSASGANARSEVLTCDGRIDLLVEFPDKVFILEFKCGQSAETALRQIREKDYAAPHRGGGRKIFLVGIDFDAETRNISGWKAEPD